MKKEKIFQHKARINEYGTRWKRRCRGSQLEILYGGKSAGIPDNEVAVPRTAGHESRLAARPTAHHAQLSYLHTTPGLCFDYK
jgi:hypothetical protein